MAQSQAPWYDQTNFLAQAGHFLGGQAFMLWAFVAAPRILGIIIGLILVQAYAIAKELYDGLRENDPDPWSQNIFDWAVWTVSSLLASGILCLKLKYL